MSSSNSSQSKLNALEAIKNYRVSELQTLLQSANVTRQGTKRDLLQRCKILINSSFTPQLANKIHQINLARSRQARSQNNNNNHHHYHVTSTTSTSSSTSSSSSRRQPIVLPKTPPLEALPQANHIQFTSLPFFEKMRTIECSNMPVDWQTFSPVRFVLNETDLELIRKNSARVFLRIAPTILNERHNDVLPPFIFVQCNNQPVLNNNVSKQVGSQAHSISFPTDITDKIILKANASNTLTYVWLQSPTNLSLKNLPKSYTISIQLVHCVSMETLFETIIKREPYSNKTEQDQDSDIEIEDLGLMTTRHRVSLICPITQSLIIVPAKSAHCSHQTCFDLKAFLQMNERRLQWTCPVCKKSAAYDSLRIDERLQSILSNVPPNCSTVEIDSMTDCQYILDNIKQEKVEHQETNPAHQTIDDDSIQNSPAKSRQQSDESDCIVLSSGSESEDENADEDLDPTSVPMSNPELDSNDKPVNAPDDNTSQSSRNTHSTPSPVISTAEDGDFWENIAQITYDLSSDASEKYSTRKRSNSSTSSVLSSACSPTTTTTQSTDDRHRRKRTKQTTDIEIITLSSNDSSDNDDPLS